MTVEEVFAKVLEAGGRVIPGSERPRLLVPPRLKLLVIEHREALRELIRSRGAVPPDPALVARLLGMRLDDFAREGCPLELRVTWLAASLWFVPGEADAEALAREGVSRGRIWTARELEDLLAIPTMTPIYMQTVAKAKLELGGEVVEIRPCAEPARWRDGGAP